MSGEIAIDANGVWKIFGKRADEALRAIHDEGLTKAQVLERFNCVVGVADASFQVKRGELFCVMGLSGSGKSTLVRHVNRLLEPTAGHIHINGEDVMGLDDAGLRDLGLGESQQIEVLPEPHRPFVRPGLAGDDVHHRRLPSTVRPDDTE